ncbi:hypothetical protein T05_10919 [Trichinella murrelli]|uniref:Uncharacterized protein n=1 Tax=Trichinella murrelli TaxID=144512 RepID=A0A0V0TWH8_9BILA|nr:hypothetical protein T05_10919 [Trichinella murrelli]
MCNQVDDLKSSLAKCIFKEKNKILTHILQNTNKTIVQFTSNKMQRASTDTYSNNNNNNNNNVTEPYLAKRAY